MKTKILPDFQICISVLLYLVLFQAHNLYSLLSQTLASTVFVQILSYLFPALKYMIFSYVKLFRNYFILSLVASSCHMQKM